MSLLETGDLTMHRNPAKWSVNARRWNKPSRSWVWKIGDGLGQQVSGKMLPGVSWEDPSRVLTLPFQILLFKLSTHPKLWIQAEVPHLRWAINRSRFR